MDFNAIDWYEFILRHYFITKDIKPPEFFTREFVKFKLPNTTNDSNHHNQKILKAKIQIYEAKINTSEMLRVLCDTSFIHFPVGQF